MIRIGTAGWAIPRLAADRFGAEGSGLERYAGRLNAAEINSTFYRSSRPSTFERWAASVPDGFRFAVKVPKSITHQQRLVGCGDLLASFLEEIAPLSARLGPLLVQLPPSLAFSSETAGPFMEDLRRRFAGDVAWEPRHSSWFEPEAEALLTDARIARVAADPARVPHAAEPGGWRGLTYWRLHGSPRMYFTPYDETCLTDLAAKLRADPAADAWCIFDNTASGAAAVNALDLQLKTGVETQP